MKKDSQVYEQYKKVRNDFWNTTRGLLKEEQVRIATDCLSYPKMFCNYIIIIIIIIIFISSNSSCKKVKIEITICEQDNKAELNCTKSCPFKINNT